MSDKPSYEELERLVAKQQAIVNTYHVLLEHSHDYILICDRDANPVAFNRAYAGIIKEFLGITMVPGLIPHKLLPDPDAVAWWDKHHERVLSGKTFKMEYTHKLDSTERHFEFLYTPIFKDGTVNGFTEISREITDRKRTEAEIKQHRDNLEELVNKRTAELAQRNIDLEESNVALKVLLQHRENDKKEIEEKVLNNLEKLVFPYLEKLMAKVSEPEEKTYVDIIEFNLREITSPFSLGMPGDVSKLTPAEIQIANLIKQGKTTKEIAQLLGLSPTTIATHRQNIRKKFDLTNKKLNLQTILETKKIR